MSRPRIVTKTAWKDVPPINKPIVCVGEPGGDDDPMNNVAFVKVFGPGRYTYFVTEWDGEDTVFGYCVSPFGADCDEWGYASISEWENAGPYPFVFAERDTSFQPNTVRGALCELGIATGDYTAAFAAK